MIALPLLLCLAAFEPEALLPDKPYVLRGHSDTVIAIAISPDASQLASVSRDKTLKLWSLKTGEVLRSVSGAEQQLSSVGWSGDGKRLAVGDVGLQVRLIDPSSGAVLHTLAHPDSVGEVALNADGSLLAVAGLSDNGAVYEVAKDGAKTTKKFEFRGRTARFSGDGKTLLISSGNGSFSLLDAKTGKARKTVTTKNELPLTTMNAAGTTIASWTAGGADVRVWTDAGKAVTVLKGPPAELDRPQAHVTGVGVLPDGPAGKRVVSGGRDGLVRLWSVEKSAVVQVWSAEKNSAVFVSADGLWLAVADSALVKLWRL
jgi:WD40 repeat protein